MIKIVNLKQIWLWLNSNLISKILLNLQKPLNRRSFSLFFLCYCFDVRKFYQEKHATLLGWISVRNVQDHGSDQWVGGWGRLCPPNYYWHLQIRPTTKSSHKLFELQIQVHTSESVPEEPGGQAKEKGFSPPQILVESKLKPVPSKDKGPCPLSSLYLLTQFNPNVGDGPPRSEEADCAPT